MADQEYDTDLALWAASQARALRDAGHAGINLPIDWENVAEEIEAFGKSQARELASRISVILVHLMKLQSSPATEPRGGWHETIVAQRNEVERILEDSPSLRQAVGRIIAREIGAAQRQASAALMDHGEAPRIGVDHLSYSEVEVLGVWLPAGT